MRKQGSLCTVQVAVEARTGALQFVTPQVLLDRVQAAIDITAPLPLIGRG